MGADSIRFGNDNFQHLLTQTALPKERRFEPCARSPFVLDPRPLLEWHQRHPLRQSPIKQKCVQRCTGTQPGLRKEQAEFSAARARGTFLRRTTKRQESPEETGCRCMLRRRPATRFLAR